MKHLAVFAIQIYRLLVSPLLSPNACRFYPTCSRYSEEAFQRYGFVKGLLMSARRVLHCHPFHPGGYDPVP